ncbi:hypothetical protein GA0070558_13230 [Micromonospora haikouensis]|uniref:Uncharacterized protein n=1 Tax=Micromonospora haikouensis TaxID=686309 RepID=A0A1C4XZE7_9ACTN|nr:hypothetical protein [Micromonospora haikouensis]SCF13825.1 hypothetical protein GA0070558_13230 [Micromonospora haikouensis]
MNPGFTSHIVEVSDVESRAILDLLYAHRDYGSERRVTHRITLRGDIPRGPQDQPRSLDG